MWRITAQYVDLKGDKAYTRCIIECPLGHPYDLMKQTVKQFDSKKCKVCDVTYPFPTEIPRKITSREGIIEVSDCFEYSYTEIAERLSITPEEAKQSCDSAIVKLLATVAADPELSAEFMEYLRSS